VERFRIFLRTCLPRVRGIPKLNKKKLICALTGFLALIYTGWIIPARISLSPTSSIGHYVFLYKSHFKPSDISKGSLVVVPLYTRIVPHCWPCLAVKYIRCDSGERLDVRNSREFYCNNVFLGMAKTHSKKGVPVKIFQYNGIIPKGKFFAMGTCIDSYDSRYVGLENKRDIKAIAVPII